jgi:hypothetical protein
MVASPRGQDALRCETVQPSCRPKSDSVYVGIDVACAVGKRLPICVVSAGHPLIPMTIPKHLAALYLAASATRKSPMRVRRETAEHSFATLKMRMGATHFLMKTLPRVATEMALHVLAYNLTRVMNILGIQPLLAAMRA